MGTATTGTATTGRSLGRPFRLLFVASTASNLGDGVLLAAVPLLARQLTDDPLAVSSVTVAATLPWLLFGLAAGAIVDRTDRRRALVRSDVLRGAVLLAFAVLVGWGPSSLPAVVALVFLLGMAETVFDTAAQAVLPALVAPERLERANGKLFAAQIAANGFVGPPLGAVLFAAGTGLPFVVDAVTFGASALLLARLPRRTPRPNPNARDGQGDEYCGPDRGPGDGDGDDGRDDDRDGDRRTTLRREVREGLVWLWGHRGVRAFAVGAAVVNLAHTAAMAVAVLLVRDELGAGELAFGLALTGAAVGSIAGSQLAAWTADRLGRRRAVLGSIAGFSLSLLAVGLAPSTVVAAAGLAAFGAAGEVWNVVAVSYRQAIVPDRLLGRVMATYRVIAYGAMPIGAAAGGLVAAAAGVRVTFLAGSSAVAALLAWFLAPGRAALLGPEPGPDPQQGGEAPQPDSGVASMASVSVE